MVTILTGLFESFRFVVCRGDRYRLVQIHLFVGEESVLFCYF
jgi:hypothetical protein